jgi:hypothetical protein
MCTEYGGGERSHQVENATLRIDSRPLFASHRTTLPLESFVGPQRLISQCKKINTCISQVYSNTHVRVNPSNHQFINCWPDIIWVSDKVDEFTREGQFLYSLTMYFLLAV